MDVTEYGRSVHAEMAAITDAAARGVAIRGATLFCTTFPCHNCARHIVSAGLRSVVYIEPYPKSQAGSLFRDSISVDPEGDEVGRVPFRSFVGVGPRLYLELFRSSERKQTNGDSVKWVGTAAEFRLATANTGYIEQEVAPAGELQGALNGGGTNG